MLCVEIEFLPGNGKRYVRPVIYISDFARGPGGTCAFCDGDPCAETSAADTPIGEVMRKGQPKGEYRPGACPFCDGRQS